LHVKIAVALHKLMTMPSKLHFIARANPSRASVFRGKRMTIRMPAGHQNRPAIVGLLLAGGKAMRIGGGDKPLQLLGGKPMLEHIMTRLAPQCDGLLLNANGFPERFARYDLPIVADGLPDAGPLAGILAGLDWLAFNQPNVQDMLVVAGDTPFIPMDLAERLMMARAETGLPLACAASSGRTHPVISLWHTDLKDALRHALVVENQRTVSRWMSPDQCAVVDWPAVPFDPFFNVNTREELIQAETFYAADEMRVVKTGSA
jgi:molybdenum cofactor guanylyltransferase